MTCGTISSVQIIGVSKESKESGLVTEEIFAEIITVKYWKKTINLEFYTQQNHLLKTKAK